MIDLLEVQKVGWTRACDAIGPNLDLDNQRLKIPNKNSFGSDDVYFDCSELYQYGYTNGWNDARTSVLNSSATVYTISNYSYFNENLYVLDPSTGFVSIGSGWVRVSETTKYDLPALRS